MDEDSGTAPGCWKDRGPEMFRFEGLFGFAMLLGGETRECLPPAAFSALTRGPGLDLLNWNISTAEEGGRHLAGGSAMVCCRMAKRAFHVMNPGSLDSWHGTGCTC